MSDISKVSFVKRALSVLTAGMFLLSGIVLTASPASASTTETVPYTYTVKVPVTKTVYEYEVVKTKIGTRTVYSYKLVPKTKTEYRIETRTGYREAPIKSADKPAAAQYKVQVADTAAFQNVKKEILVTPSAPGTNKVNLASQLAGSVGDTTFVRVVAKNAAGKSTPGKATKLAFGEVSRSNYNVQVPYTAYATQQKTAGFWYTDYNKPTYSSVWRDAVYGTRYVDPTYGTRLVTGRDWYWGSEAYTAYRTESYRAISHYKSVFSHNETYYVTVSFSYECGYWTTARPKYPSRYISQTCTGTEREPRQRAVYESVPVYYTAYRDVAYTAYRDVKVWYDYSYWESYQTGGGYNESYLVSNGYWDSVHTGYGSSYAEPTYETYAYTAYTTETRVAITNGWKAATN